MKESYFRQEVIEILKAYGDYKETVGRANTPTHQTLEEVRVIQSTVPSKLERMEKVVPRDIREELGLPVARPTASDGGGTYDYEFFYRRLIRHLKEMMSKYRSENLPPMVEIIS